MRRHQRLILKAGVSTAVGLLLAELLLRIAMPQIGWGPQTDLPVGWSTDEYREFDPNAPIPAEVKRILFLGDSYLAGSGVSSLDERFTDRLAQRLGDRVHVQVLASGGWGTDQQLLAFIQKGKVWNPDLVIVAFCSNNDLTDILSNRHAKNTYKPYFVLGDDGALQLFSHNGQPIAEAGDTRTQSRRLQSYLFDLIHHVIRSARPDQPQAKLGSVDPRYLQFDAHLKKRREIFMLQQRLTWSPQTGITPVSAYIREDFESNRYQWRLMDAILARLKRECDEIGAPLMLMLLPVPFVAQDIRFIAGGELEFRFDTPDGPFTFRSAEPRDRLRPVCERHGIHWFDPSGGFIQRVREENLLLKCWPHPRERHFSAVGHDLLAEQLHRHLETHSELLGYEGR